MNSKQIETELDEQEYQDILDEIYGDVEVCGMTYGSGYVLRELDPIAFRCGKSDYESEQDSENPRFECGVCGDEFDGNNAEEEAENCCQE